MMRQYGRIGYGSAYHSLNGEMAGYIEERLPKTMKKEKYIGKNGIMDKILIVPANDEKIFPRAYILLHQNGNEFRCFIGTAGNDDRETYSYHRKLESIAAEGSSSKLSPNEFYTLVLHDILSAHQFMIWLENARKMRVISPRSALFLS